MLVLLLSLAAGGSAPAQSVTVSVLDMLELYALGEHATVRSALDAASRGDFGPVIETLERDAPGWIEADGREQRARRRLVVATFSLDAAHAALDTQWAQAKRILEWACALLRAEEAPSPQERLFHLAAVGIIEGAHDVEALDEHLGHARTRFPSEPRWLLAEAFKNEVEYWRLFLTIMGRADGGDPDIVAPALVKAAERAENRREAALRLGFVTYYAGRYDDARRHLAAVPPGDDPGQLYLAHLIAGWSYEKQHQSDEAIREFRAALAAVPRAQAATLHAAALLYAQGQRADADVMVELMLAEGADVVDPWRLFGYGDFRRVPALIAALQEAVR